LTVNEMVAVSEPPLFVAVMVYVAAETCTVGVPLMTPVELRLRPEGREGDADQKALSPVLVGVMLEIAAPCVNVNGEPE